MGEERILTKEEVWDLVRNLGTSPKPDLEMPRGNAAAMKGDILRVAEMYKSGKSCATIGMIYGANEKTVARWLRAADVKIREHKKPTRELISGKEEEIIQRYQKGDSPYMLARDYGVTRRPIWKILKEAGVYTG